MISKRVPMVTDLGLGPGRFLDDLCEIEGI